MHMQLWGAVPSDSAHRRPSKHAEGRMLHGCRWDVEGLAKGNGQRWFMKNYLTTESVMDRSGFSWESAYYVCRERASSTAQVTDILDSYS